MLIGLKGEKGESGSKIVNTELIGQDENGGNIYKQTFDDGSTAQFVAPRGEQGERGEGLEKIEPEVERINTLIPAQANNENQLADKEFVNSSISTLTASYAGMYDTHEQLVTDTNPKNNNDYAIVLNDETHNGETWRYKYSATIGWWIAEYKVNDTPLTAEQLAAVNSGVTAELVGQISTNKTDVATLKAQLPTKQDLIGDIVDTGWVETTGYFGGGSWSYLQSEVAVKPKATYIMQYSIVVNPNTVTQKGDNMIIRSTTDNRTGLTFPVSPTDYAQATLTEIITIPEGIYTASFQLYSSRVYGSDTDPQLTKSVRIKAIKING